MTMIVPAIRSMHVAVFIGSLAIFMDGSALSIVRMAIARIGARFRLEGRL